MVWLVIVAVLATVLWLWQASHKKSKRRKRYEDKIVTPYLSKGEWIFTVIDRGDHSRDRHEDTMV